MRTFGWAVKDGGIFRGAHLENLGFFGDKCELAHAVGAGEMGLSRYRGCISYDSRLIEYFFASFVRALQLWLLPVEERHVIRLPLSLNHRV